MSGENTNVTIFKDYINQGLAVVIVLVVVAVAGHYWVDVGLPSIKKSNDAEIKLKEQTGNSLVSMAESHRELVSIQSQTVEQLRGVKSDVAEIKTCLEKSHKMDGEK